MFLSKAKPIGKFGYDRSVPQATHAKRMGIVKRFGKVVVSIDQEKIGKCPSESIA
jgi:hypothetical protein